VVTTGVLKAGECSACKASLGGGNGNALAGLNNSILAIPACLVGWTLGVDTNGSTIAGGNFALDANQLPFVWMDNVLKQ
jgi:hypothetical protein